MAPLVPDTRPPTTESPETVHRTVRVRLYPGDAATGHRLAGTAGACRHVWNAILADYDLAYRMWRAFGKLGPGPGPRPSSPLASGSRNCATTRRAPG